MAASDELGHEFLTRSAEETIAVGHRIAALISPPRVLLLSGELGAGKTTLVKGIAERFGAAQQDEVTSPTFTLVHEYRAERMAVYHLDVYRIESERELETIAIDDLRSSNALLLIEWGERFESLRQIADAEITISLTPDEERRITLRSLTGEQ